MQLKDRADALVAPKPNADTLGPCKRHPEATEIAFYVISTAMVCFVASAAFPLVLSCIGAANRMWAKKTARQTPVETREEEGTEMKPWARVRKYGVAAASAAAAKEDKKECFVVDVHETEDQDAIKEAKASQTEDEIEDVEKTGTKEDDAEKEGKI